MKSVAFVFATLGVLPGCAFGVGDNYGDAYGIYIDSTFTPDEVSHIQNAMRNWELMTPVKFSVLPGDCPGMANGRICVFRSDKAALNYLGNVADELGGTYVERDWLMSIDGGLIYLAMDVIYANPDTPIESVIGHEFGHAIMGSPHEPNSLMEAVNVDHFILPQCPDIERYANLRDRQGVCQ